MHAEHAALCMIMLTVCVTLLQVYKIYRELKEKETRVITARETHIPTSIQAVLTVLWRLNTWKNLPAKRDNSPCCRNPVSPVTGSTLQQSEQQCLLYCAEKQAWTRLFPSHPKSTAESLRVLSESGQDHFSKTCHNHAIC